MRRLGYIVLFALAAISFAACGAPATNAPANANANSNSNANAAKPVAAAPTADALFALDKQANEAYANQRVKDDKELEALRQQAATAPANTTIVVKKDMAKRIGGIK